MFVCFQRGAAIVLSRLLEANKIGGHAYPLEHITLVALPDGDAVPNSGNTNQVFAVPAVPAAGSGGFSWRCLETVVAWVDLARVSPS